MKATFGLISAGFAMLLAGCGGGGADVTVVAPAPQFIVWPGSAGGIHVVDGVGHVFEFFSDTGCLFNAQTGRENTAFCLIPGSRVVAYGPFHGQIDNVIAADGTCQAAIIDQFTGNFADIEVDSFGREVVAITALRPVFC